MRILYDAAATQGYGATKYHGGGEYAKTVLRACLEDLPVDVELEVHLDPRRYLDPNLRELLEGQRIKVHEVSTAKGLAALLSTGRFQRYYSALPIDAGWDFPIPRETEFIFTLHGLRGRITRGWRHRLAYGDSLLKAVAATAFLFVFGASRQRQVEKRYRRKIEATENRTVITVSRYGKYSFVAALPEVDLSEARILDSVMDSHAERDPSILDRSALTPERFLLLVSANRYEKNAVRALRALDKFFELTRRDHGFRDLRVAVTGVSSQSRFARYLKLRHRDRFVFLDYVSSGELEELYASASCLVYPSLSEGYGYPPIQAMRHGTPSICAGATAIPEICGDAAIYFNPFDPDEIISSVYEVLDRQIYDSMVPLMRSRAMAIQQRQDLSLREIVRIILRPH